MTPEERQTACEQITAEAYGKVEELFGLIRDFVKMPDLQFKANLREYRDGDKRIEFDSDDIAKKDYLISLAWKEFKISNFNSNATVDRQSEEPYYWITVHYDYKHIDGGSNGAEIGFAEFRNGNWKFYSDIERYKD